MRFSMNSYDFERLPGTKISSENGDYEIGRRLGTGGMAVVFFARDLRQGREVAIKFILPEIMNEESFVRRFIREARAGAVLSHPNIVKVFDSDKTADGLVFIVMEYVDGEALDEFLESNGPLPIARAANFITPLCEALECAHKANILHRDLKPANIMVTKDAAGNENIKLTDFGLVKLLEPDDRITAGNTALTEVGTAMGTPKYMSPEHLLGDALTPASDIYSVGIILCELLTGFAPFECKSEHELRLKISQDPQPLSQRFPNLPASLDRVIAKVLMRDAKARYQSAMEFLKEFNKVVDEVTGGNRSGSGGGMFSRLVSRFTKK